MIKAQEAGLPTSEPCRKHRLSPATLNRLKAKYGGMDLSDAERPHSSLGHRPPAPEVISWPASPSGAASPATPAVAPRPVMHQD